MMKHSFLTFLIAASSVSASALTPVETLDFLYSTMSLPDSVDYPRDFYVRNVESSLQARREMPWGISVPDREFLHFVVPVRVNNENLDSARQVFYRELKPRVKDLTMRDAILAVNHWCHEKVTYRPSDVRTSSPLSTVSQAIGRCGEESTFCVAALRSVGIPARQIYTPRWAHTDDNHAWVEAWADGRWYFLGACEPEPVLNLAWFNAPASRGMLMSTNVAGNYTGPEEVLLREPLTTRINVTSNYAPVATLPVSVVYADGRPAAGAKVNFCIYNYAEYYPAVTKMADSEGFASLTCGLGDLFVWASDGSKFGWAYGAPTDFSDGGLLKVIIDKDASYAGDFELTLTPPASGTALPDVTSAQREANNRMLASEDSIRELYTSTFATRDKADSIARKLDIDAARLSPLLVASRGNHKNIEDMLRSLSPSERTRALGLLESVTEKDLRDMPMAVVIDALQHTAAIESPDDDYYKFILNPRVENEGLRPWRGALSQFFAPMAEQFRDNPELLVKWVSTNIEDASSQNPGRLRISPAGVLAVRRADPASRNIFFVAAARSIGIPSRIDPVTSAVLYQNSGGNWVDVLFDDVETQGGSTAKSAKGALKLTFEPQGHMVDPKYYSQFSISRIDNGVPVLLEYPEDGTLTTLFGEPYTLDAGQYILTSGQRMADGGVLAHSDIFTIKPGETVTLPLTLRQDNTRLSVIGSLNAENIYHDLTSSADKSLISTTGRGYYVLGLISPNHEPSAHAINDISAVAESLEADGSNIMLLFDDAEAAARFNRSLFGKLPSNVVFGIDKDGVSRKEILESLHIGQADSPVFVIADTFNRIVWYSSGYTIGLGETLLRHLSTLD